MMLLRKIGDGAGDGGEGRGWKVMKQVGIREERQESQKSLWLGFLGCLQAPWSEAAWPVETDTPEVPPLLTEESTGDRKFW